MFGSHPCVKATRACVRCVAFCHVEKKLCVYVSAAVWQCAGVGSVSGFMIGRMKLGVMASNQFVG